MMSRGPYSRRGLSSRSRFFLEHHIMKYFEIKKSCGNDGYWKHNEQEILQGPTSCSISVSFRNSFLFLDGNSMYTSWFVAFFSRHHCKLLWISLKMVDVLRKGGNSCVVTLTFDQVISQSTGDLGRGIEGLSTGLLNLETWKVRSHFQGETAPYLLFAF